MIPTTILTVWFTGLLSLGMIGGGAYLAYRWYDEAWAYDENLRRFVFDPDLGWNGETALLAAAVALIAWTFAGGAILRAVASLMGGAKRGQVPPSRERGGEVHRLARPDGTSLRVECYGPADATPIVLTHGWGSNSTQWFYLKRQLGERYRLIAWDLPGLGLSTRPDNNDFSLEKMARDLEAVLGLAGDRPALLVGHSIGGMTILTFCRLFPEALGRRVAGLVLVHTTYTNPVRTTKNAALATAIEKPVLVPLLWITIALDPLVRLMNWLGYLNGSAQLSSRQSGFAGTQEAGQVDFTARNQAEASPSVLARGMFGMLAYDATATLPTIGVPTLVVPGDRDTVCPPEASVKMHRDIPAARLDPLAPAKHMGFLEQNEHFAALLDEFARSCTRQPEPAVGR